jgi:hypothetical protein
MEPKKISTNNAPKPIQQVMPSGIDKTKSFKQKKKISKGTRGYGLK